MSRLARRGSGSQGKDTLRRRRPPQVLQVSAPLPALPHAERPRERLWSLGPAALTSVELLAILVGTGTGGCTSLDIAARLLEVGGGSLRRVAMRPRAELLQAEGIGPGKGARLLAAFEVGARLAGEDRPTAPRIR
jgi:DNA repair protein RadC